MSSYPFLRVALWRDVAKGLRTVKGAETTQRRMLVKRFLSDDALYYGTYIQAVLDAAVASRRLSETQRTQIVQRLLEEQRRLSNAFLAGDLAVHDAIDRFEDFTETTLMPFKCPSIPGLESMTVPAALSEAVSRGRLPPERSKDLVDSYIKFQESFADGKVSVQNAEILMSYLRDSLLRYVTCTHNGEPETEPEPEPVVPQAPPLAAVDLPAVSLRIGGPRAPEKSSSDLQRLLASSLTVRRQAVADLDEGEDHDGAARARAIATRPPLLAPPGPEPPMVRRFIPAEEFSAQAAKLRPVDRGVRPTTTSRQDMAQIMSRMARPPTMRIQNWTTSPADSASEWVTNGGRTMRVTREGSPQAPSAFGGITGVPPMITSLIRPRLVRWWYRPPLLHYGSGPAPPMGPLATVKQGGGRRKGKRKN
jgi:hypothetical protein